VADSRSDPHLAQSADGQAIAYCILASEFDNALMTRMQQILIGFLGVCGLTVVGCASAGPSPLSFSLRHIESSKESPAFLAAQAALADEGYSIDRADRIAGVIITQPVEEPARVDGTRVRLSSRDRFRRLAEVRISGHGEDVRVYCRVAIQEQVTAAHRMFAYDRSGTDDPGITPIERDAATTEEQNTVWQTLRRDKVAERRILETILKNIGE